ncbi:MAG: glycine cleavage system protein GcvH [Gammaproteobacteria bacterium]|nr:glycine cleavage system protein GcvH [Gammaproteobacteria bacterium]
MSNLPHELKYSKSHEWVRDEGDGTYTVGITDHAQGLLGDMVFVELPELERVVNAEEECAVVESVKAASDVYAPLGGTIIEVNSAVEESPELVNQDPYGDGWLFKLSDISGLDALLDADAYAEMVDES